MKHQIVHALQKYVLNPPIKMLFAIGVAQVVLIKVALICCNNLHIDTRQGWEHTCHLLSGETRVWQGSERFLLGVKEDIQNHNFRKSNFYCAMMVLLLSYSAWAQSSNVAEAGRGISNPNS